MTTAPLAPNMKLLVVTAVIAVAAAGALSAQSDDVIAGASDLAARDGSQHSAKKNDTKFYYRILKQQFDLHDDHSYESSFETENGISASESGKSVSNSGDEASYAVQGRYSYVGDDGVTYTVTYVADANGFQPQADHLPTPPPTEYPTPEVPATQPGQRADAGATYQ